VSHWALVALLAVKRSASCVAFKVVRCNMYVLSWCAFPHPLSSKFSCWDLGSLWQGVRRVSVYSKCSFVLGILVQTVYSATQWLVACLRCMLHVRICCGALCVTCLVVHTQAVEYFVRLHSLLSPNLCLCDGWGKYLHILYCQQGAPHMGRK